MPTFRQGAGEVRGWAPAVDMLDRKDEVIIRTDLPGLEQKDIDVNTGEGVLTIRGERTVEVKAEEGMPPGAGSGAARKLPGPDDDSRGRASGHGAGA